MGVAKWQIIKNDLVKGSSTRQKLQNTGVFASTATTYFRGEDCRYKFEVN